MTGQCETRRVHLSLRFYGPGNFCSAQCHGTQTLGSVEGWLQRARRS